MAQVIPSRLAGGVLIAIDYDPTGLAWCALFDMPISGWTVDETGAAEPVPQLIGSLPPAAPDTSPTQTPQWAVYVHPAVLVPEELWRGSAGEFFTWLATNGGVVRQLEPHFGASSKLHNAFEAWARDNPDLVGPIGFGFPG